MIIGTVTVVVAGGLAGILGAALAPRLRGFAEQQKIWLDRRMVGATTAVAGAAAAMLATNWPELIAFVLLGIGCALLVLVDLTAFRLPDLLVGPLYLVLIAGLLAASALGDDWRRLLSSLITGAGLMVGYFLLGLVTGRLGLGDVKLAGLLGIFLGWIGWSQTALGTLAGFAVGAVVAVVLLATRKASVGSEFPFGPCMVVGAVLGVLFGPAAFPALG